MNQGASVCISRIVTSCWGGEPQTGDSTWPAGPGRAAADQACRCDDPSRRGPQRLASSTHGGDSRAERQELRVLFRKTSRLKAKT
jgi:hypothetical protein